MAQASEDIFHDVIMSEEKSQMEGYAAGHSEGLKVGLMEGYNLGWEKGASIGSELGFYSGFCSALLKQLEQEENKKSRALRVLQSIIKLVEEFPMTDPTHSQLIELLQQIRSKFKQNKRFLYLNLGANFYEKDTRQMTSLLNIDASYGGGEISQSKGSMLDIGDVYFIRCYRLGPGEEIFDKADQIKRYSWVVPVCEKDAECYKKMYLSEDYSCFIASP